MNVRVESIKYSGNKMLWNLASLALLLCCFTLTLQRAAGNVKRDTNCTQGAKEIWHYLECDQSFIAFPLYSYQGFKPTESNSGPTYQNTERCPVEESDCLGDSEPILQGCLQGPKCNVCTSKPPIGSCNDSFLPNSSYSVVDYACVNASRRMRSSDGFNLKAHDVMWTYSQHNIGNLTMTCSVISNPSQCSANVSLLPHQDYRVRNRATPSCFVSTTDGKTRVTCNSRQRGTHNVTTPFDVTFDILESPKSWESALNAYIGSSCELEIDCSRRNPTTPSQAPVPAGKTTKKDSEVGTNTVSQGYEKPAVATLGIVLIVAGGVLVMVAVTIGFCYFRRRSRMSTRQHDLALPPHPDVAPFPTEADYESLRASYINISGADRPQPGAANSGYIPLSARTRVQPRTQADYTSLNNDPNGFRNADTHQPRTDSSGYLIPVAPGNTPSHNTGSRAASDYVNADTPQPRANNSSYLTPVFSGSETRTPKSCKAASGYVNAGPDDRTADTPQPGANNSSYLTPVFCGSKPRSTEKTEAASGDVKAVTSRPGYLVLLLPLPSDSERPGGPRQASSRP